MQMRAVDTMDPLQGQDVQVFVSTASGAQILVGSFTSILVRFVNVTETYIELNQRVPRHLDGEINIVWQLERGMLNMNVLQDTFGFFQVNGQAYGIDRSQKVPRARRFNISFASTVSPDDFLPGEFAGGQNGMMMAMAGNAGLGNVPPFKTYHLLGCKVDTFSFGATAGRSVVANQWQGTAEGYQLI